MENALNNFREMRMYYLAYDYDGHGDVEFLTGPYANYHDADNARDLLVGSDNDSKVVIVKTFNEVEIM